MRVAVGNLLGKPASGKMSFTASFQGKPVGKGSLDFSADGRSTVVETEVPLGSEIHLWDEFQPNLYTMEAKLVSGSNKNAAQTTFGVRDFKTSGRQFTINGRPVLLRGRTDDAIFPQTLYPHMDVGDWKRLWSICKDWGLNHVRFHSWCPPRAAFIAADEVGIYLQPEGPAFENIKTPEEKEFVAEECRRILDTYGNHPSFVMFTGGNEWSGFDEWVEEWKQRDNRRLYARATNGGGFSPVNDFWSAISFGRAGWGKAMKHPGCLRGAYHDPLVGHINNSPPSTMVSYLDSLNLVGVPKASFIPQVVDRPVVAHESGQFNAYPDFREIDKCKGAVRMGNLEIFRKKLESAKMLDQANDFVRASGELQVILYREEIEAALRTPGLGGFQLLDLQDYPGQGTAQCGILDTFMESKGYGNPKEFRQWCAPVVPLLRMKQYTWTTGETFQAEAQLAHYGPAPFDAAVMNWSINDEKGAALASGTLPAKRVAPGEVAGLGNIEAPLAKFSAPAVYTVTLSLQGTDILNSWKIWVYPENLPDEKTDILVTEVWNQSVEQALAAGRKVLYLPKASALPRSIPGSFATDFWSYSMFKGQNPPGTLGLLMDPKHPMFADFPTDFHSNWQWWDLAKRSRSMILDDLPSDFRPTLQVIDNLDRVHRLGAIFEAKVGPGSVVVSSMDLVSDLPQRPAARQLRHSLLRYMNSAAFRPTKELKPETLATLGQVKNDSDGLEIAEPLGVHRASLIVSAAANVPKSNVPWQQGHDRVDTQETGYDYSINPETLGVQAFGTNFWRTPRLNLTLSVPKGYTGKLFVRFQDLGRMSRRAAVSLNGKNIGTLKGHEYGAWVMVPLTAEDSPEGKIEFQALAPDKKDLVVTEFVLMPTGAFDPG